MYIYTVSHANLGLADLFDNTQFQPLGIDAQTIAYAILGMLCGLMAAFFIYCTAYLLTLRRTGTFGEGVLEDLRVVQLGNAQIAPSNAL